jgi:hypothetical protein
MAARRTAVISESADSEYFARKVKENGGVYAWLPHLPVSCAALGYDARPAHRWLTRGTAEPYHPRGA